MIQFAPVSIIIKKDIRISNADTMSSVLTPFDPDVFSVSNLPRMSEREKDRLKENPLKEANITTNEEAIQFSSSARCANGGCIFHVAFAYVGDSIDSDDFLSAKRS